MSNLIFTDRSWQSGLFVQLILDQIRISLDLEPDSLAVFLQKLASKASIEA